MQNKRTEKLIENNYDVIVVDNINTRHGEDINLKVKL